MLETVAFNETFNDSDETVYLRSCERTTAEIVHHKRLWCCHHEQFSPGLNLPIDLMLSTPKTYPYLGYGRNFKKIIRLGVRHNQLIYSQKPRLHVFMFRQSLDTNSEPHDKQWMRIIKLALTQPAVCPTFEVPVTSSQFRYHFVAVAEVNGHRSMYSECRTFCFPGWETFGFYDHRIYQNWNQCHHHTRIFMSEGLESSGQSMCITVRPIYGTHNWTDIPPFVPVKNVECFCHPANDPVLRARYWSCVPVSYVTLEILEAREEKFDILPQLREKVHRKGLMRVRLTIDSPIEHLERNSRWHVFIAFQRPNCELVRKALNKKYPPPPTTDIPYGELRQLYTYCQHKNIWYDATGLGDHSIPVVSREAEITIKNLPVDERMHVVGFISNIQSRGPASDCKQVFLMSDASRMHFNNAYKTT